MTWKTVIDFLPILGLIFAVGLSIVFWVCMLVEAATQRHTAWVIVLIFFPPLGSILYWGFEYRFKKSREALGDRELLLQMLEESSRRDH